MAKPGRGADQFPLRLPPGMRDQIKRAAEQAGRSMNSEILEILREYFPEEPTVDEVLQDLKGALEVSRELISRYQARDDLDKSTGRRLEDVLDTILALNSNLDKASREDLDFPVAVKLRSDVRERTARLAKEFNLDPAVHEELVNNLIRMSAEQILQGEANLRVWIGGGDVERSYEIARPDPSEDDESVDQPPTT